MSSGATVIIETSLRLRFHYVTPNTMRVLSQGIFMLLLALSLLAVPAQARTVVSGVTVDVGDGGRETLQLTANGPLTVMHRFALSDPTRLVIDLKPVEAKEISLPETYQGTLMTSLRFGRFSPSVSRLVIEVTSPEVTGRITPSATGLTVVLSQVAAASTPTKPAAPATPAKTSNLKKKQGSKAATEDAPPAPATANAVAIENAKPLIVIDAGHGGQDPGAIGRHDVHEKDITLKVALALKDGLLRTGRYRVALTREDDRYILLPERVAIARKLKGDIFISIHADSNPLVTARGLSVYTLSETASDDEAQALAERENKSDIIGGLDLNTADKDVASILIDLTQRETADKSSKFADALVASLHPKITRLEGAHRFAGFRVLKAPDIPSVLIELGFVSNPTDEKLLQSPDYHAVIVSSIIKGIDRYRGAKPIPRPAQKAG